MSWGVCQIFVSSIFAFVFVRETGLSNKQSSIIYPDKVISGWSHSHRPSLPPLNSYYLIFPDIPSAQLLSQRFMGQPGSSVWQVLPGFQPLLEQRPSTHSSGCCHMALDSQETGLSRDARSTHPHRELGKRRALTNGAEERRTEGESRLKQLSVSKLQEKLNGVEPTVTNEEVDTKELKSCVAAQA